MHTGVVKRESVPFSFVTYWPHVFSKHLSKRLEQSIDAIKRILGVYFCALDQLLATPFANVNVVEGDFGPSLFDIINNSRYAKLWHGALIGVGLLALLIGHIVAVYRTLRNYEKKSHFFYFRRLLQSEQNSRQIKEAMGEDGTNIDILSAAAYFYSPGISRLVCRKRRFFCRGKRREEYANLKHYLTEKGKRDKETEKEILDSIFIETIDKLVKFLNQRTEVENLSGLPEKFQRKPGASVTDPCIIGFSEAYSRIFFSGEISLTEEGDKKENAKKNVSNVSLGRSILEAIEEASFFYWIWMFAFSFAPTVGIVAGLSFPPLALAFLFLTIRCVYVTYAFKKDSINEQIRSLNNTETDDVAVERFKRKCEIDSVELKKQDLFINLKATSIRSRRFKGSKLDNDLKKVLGKRRFMKVVAIVEGFLRGCFLPFFGIWLFNDLFKVVAGLAIGGTVIGPGAPAIFAVIFMVIAGGTLLLGVGYGIKKAIKAGKELDERYENLAKEVKKLRNYYSGDNEEQVLTLSLRDYDRLLRRYSLEQPVWTQVKKFLNRLWVVVGRLGTGSLVFRLVIWGSITSFITIPATLVAPVSLPFIAIFALVFAAWYAYAYHIESKCKRAENILDNFYSSRMMEIHDKARAVDKKEEWSTELLATPKLFSTKSEMNLHNLDSPDLKKVDPNASGGTSPDSMKSKISFNNTSRSHLLSSDHPLRRIRSESLCQHINSSDEAQNSNGMLRGCQR